MQIGLTGSRLILFAPEKHANPVPQRPLSDLRVLKIESCIRYNYTVKENALHIFFKRVNESLTSIPVIQSVSQKLGPAKDARPDFGPLTYEVPVAAR